MTDDNETKMLSDRQTAQDAWNDMRRQRDAALIERDDAIAMRDAINAAKAPASAEELGLAEMRAGVAEAALAAMTAERDELRAQLAEERELGETRQQIINDLNDGCVESEKRLTAMTAERDAEKRRADNAVHWLAEGRARLATLEAALPDHADVYEIRDALTWARVRGYTRGERIGAWLRRLDAATATDKPGYVHATTAPGPRHARAVNDAVPPTCPDKGTCHHHCPVVEQCFRVRTCAPLSGSGLNDDWTPKAAPAVLSANWQDRWRAMGWTGGEDVERAERERRMGAVVIERLGTLDTDEIDRIADRCVDMKSYESDRVGLAQLLRAIAAEIRGAR